MSLPASSRSQGTSSISCAGQVAGVGEGVEGDRAAAEGVEARRGQLRDPPGPDEPDGPALEARDRPEVAGVGLLAAVQRGVEVADPPDQHRREHHGMVGDDVRAVVGHVADAHAGAGRGGEVDVVDADAVADDHRVRGEPAELARPERREVREHHVGAVERRAELVRPAVLGAGLLRQRALEPVVAHGGVGDGDDRAHAAPRRSRNSSRSP